MTPKPLEKTEPKLPRRDWVLLPMLAVLTMLFVAIAAETTAGKVFTKSKMVLGTCMTSMHGQTGIQGIPNCVTYEKDFDTPLVQYKFDRCGFRSDVGCDQHKPGEYRIVMLGSSVAFGQWAPQDATIADRLPIDIKEKTNRTVELYNEAMMQEFPQFSDIRLRETVKSKPDMILWVVSAYDVSMAPLTAKFVMQVAGATGKSHLAWWSSYLKLLFANNSVLSVANTLEQHTVDRLRSTATGTALQDVLYAGGERYVKAYLGRPDAEAGYMSLSSSNTWNADYQSFARYAADMAAVSKAANVPFVVTLVPTRAQAAMLSSGVWPSGYDPDKLDQEIRSIVLSCGGQYVDIFPYLRHVPNLEKHFYMNGHPDAQGHIILSHAIADELTNGHISTLQASGNTTPIQTGKK